MTSIAVLARRSGRRSQNIVVDTNPAELVWIDGPPTLNAIGATANSRAVVRNAEHQALAALTPTYTSLATGVATVNASGVVTAVSNGTATIQASYAGLTTIAQTATVTQLVSQITGVAAPLATDDASNGTFSPVGKDANGNTVSGATFLYSSSNPSVITVDASGNWAGQSAGTATITITPNPRVPGYTFTVSVTVTAVTFTISQSPNPAYLGNAITFTTQLNGADATSSSSFTTDTPSVVAVDAPTFTSITSSTVTQGDASVSHSIVGTNLRTGQTLGGLPTGVTASAITASTSTAATVTISATGSATTGSANIYLIDSTHGNSGTVALTVSASSGPNVTAGLSGVGFYSNDFSSYANDAALKGDTTNLSFYTTSGSYGALSSSTQYNGHNTFAQKLLNDGSQAGIGTEAAATIGWNTTAATYRATIKWTAGYTVPTSATHNLLMIYAKDTSKYSVTTLNCIARLYIVNSAGTLTYKLDTVVKNAADNAFISTVQTQVIGTVGAELTNGYTIDYFVRVVQTDSTHFTVTAWLGKNVSGTVSNVMQLTTTTRTLSTADATFYQGQFRPDGFNTQGTPATTQTTYICQMEGVDENAHPDVYNLAAAASTYTPLT